MATQKTPQIIHIIINSVNIYYMTEKRNKLFLHDSLACKWVFDIYTVRDTLK